MKKLLTLITVITLVFGTTATAFALSANKAVTTTGVMSVSIPAGGRDFDSSVVTFDFNSLPANAIVDKVVIESTKYTASGGPIAVNNIFVKNNNSMTDYVSTKWYPQALTLTTPVRGFKAQGTWSMYFTGVNASSYDAGARSQQSAKLTVYYTY